MSMWIPNICSAIAGNRPVLDPNVQIYAKVYLARGASQKWWWGNRKSNTTVQPSSGPSLWFSLGRFASGCSLCNLQLSESNELNDCKSLAWVLLGLTAPAAHRRAGAESGICEGSSTCWDDHTVHKGLHQLQTWDCKKNVWGGQRWAHGASSSAFLGFFRAFVFLCVQLAEA